jgi:hypothetical protein
MVWGAASVGPSWPCLEPSGCGCEGSARWSVGVGVRVGVGVGVVVMVLLVGVCVGVCLPGKDLGCI